MTSTFSEGQSKVFILWLSPRVIFNFGYRGGTHLPGMDNFLPKYSKWPGHATHGTGNFWPEFTLLDQGFDDIKNKFCIYFAEVMAQCGLILLNMVTPIRVVLRVGMGYLSGWTFWSLNIWSDLVMLPHMTFLAQICLLGHVFDEIRKNAYILLWSWPNAAWFDSIWSIYPTPFRSQTQRVE